jgi:hypothetical protein
MTTEADHRNAELPVKALSIAQPWAELILRRRKPYEIRTWKTGYRGVLLVHAEDVPARTGISARHR